jgi:hypothetical protein
MQFESLFYSIDDGYMGQCERPLAFTRLKDVGDNGLQTREKGAEKSENETPVGEIIVPVGCKPDAYDYRKERQ